ncbi:MAG: NAD(P)H-dependent oxidoreductase subunit E, partial [Planctomycetota bacterium]
MPTRTDSASEIDLSVIESIVAEIGGRPSDVIAILQAIQRRYNYLPREALLRVAEISDISPSALAGVATFYSQFRLRPAGLHTVRVCIGTACHVKGATQVFDAFMRHLDIPEGEDTDPRRLFTVEKVACLGCCMLAPAVQIDDVTYGFLTSEKVPRVLRDFLAGAAEGAAEAAGAPAPEADGEIRTCLCSSCAASGADRVFDELRSQAGRLSLPVRLKKTACTGASFQAPLVEVKTPGERSFHYGRVAPRDVAPLLLRHFRPSGVGGRVRAAFDRWLTGMVEERDEPVLRYGPDVRDGADIAFHGPQVRIATEHAGLLDPLDFDEYEARGGFRALEECRQGLSPDAVVEQVQEAGLRGRGGAGFPTGTKLRLVREAPGEEKAVICNGDEGDPGAFMDRMILESFPFRVLEGLLIACHAVGANEAVLYVRAEYPLAVRTIRTALGILEERGVLGAKGEWPVSIRLAVGAGAFVCGEETALMEAIEGRRGNPRFRPPYPSERGLEGKPTLVNNVETLALLPWILREGADAFRGVGTQDSPGTKTFALAGKILRGGLIEVPMGLTLRRIVEEIGGGLAEGRRL